MEIQNNNDNSHKTKKIFLIFIIYSITLICSNILVEEFFYGNKVQQIAIDNAVNQSLERKEVLNLFLQKSENDLLTLRKSTFFIDYINNSKNIIELENLFLTLASSNKNYKQLKYVNKNGQEIIRVDRDYVNSDVFLVSNNELKNETDRYYFKKSKAKALEKVWFSAIDLNIKNNKVEIPYIPTFRAILSIEKDGRFDGFLIIKYFMEDFLKEFTNTPLYDITLFNNKGYTICHYGHEHKYEHKKCWGNSLEHKYNISDDFPKLYEQILNKSLLKTENFVSRRFDLPIYDGLNILMELKKDYLEQHETYIKNRYIVIGLITIIISLILTKIVTTLFDNELTNNILLQKMNNNLNNLYKHFKRFVDAQDNMVILTDGNTIKFINRKFKKFFKYKNLSRFLQDHKCVSEFFINSSNEFFYTKKVGENWIEEIKKIEPENRIVAMKNSKNLILYFKLNITSFDDELYIVSFTEITKTIIEKIDLKDKINHDKLTNLLNREYFYTNYEKLITSYSLDEYKFALAFIDIDDFKFINDNYGHNMGDKVLINLSNLLKQMTRDSDYVIRWGGEEFLIVLKVRNIDSLKKVLENLRISIQNSQIFPDKPITCSIGGTIYKNSEDIESTIRRSDENMYQAKRSGKNQVIVF